MKNSNCNYNKFIKRLKAEVFIGLNNLFYFKEL
jgi:hypothetical protein